MTDAALTLFWTRTADDAEQGFRAFKMALESTVLALRPGDHLHIEVKPH